MVNKENFSWEIFLEPYELAVEGFIIKLEGIKKQYNLHGLISPFENVLGRVKTAESITAKAKRMNVPFELIDEKLYDIAGIRIICKYVDDIYQVRKLLLSRKDITLVEEKDYVNNPKASGYKSLHLICKYNVETIEGQKTIYIEFQIRTLAMHFWATTEHDLKYKYSRQIPDEIKEKLVQAAKSAAQLDQDMLDIRYAISIFEHENDKKI